LVGVISGSEKVDGVEFDQFALFLHGGSVRIVLQVAAQGEAERSRRLRLACSQAAMKP
jgi:hypothetical protein